MGGTQLESGGQLGRMGSMSVVRDALRIVLGRDPRREVGRAARRQPSLRSMVLRSAPAYRVLEGGGTGVAAIVSRTHPAYHPGRNAQAGESPAAQVPSLFSLLVLQSSRSVDADESAVLLASIDLPPNQVSLEALRRILRNSQTRSDLELRESSLDSVLRSWESSLRKFESPSRILLRADAAVHMAVEWELHRPQTQTVSAFIGLVAGLPPAQAAEMWLALSLVRDPAVERTVQESKSVVDWLVHSDSVPKIAQFLRAEAPWSSARRQLQDIASTLENWRFVVQQCPDILERAPSSGREVGRAASLLYTSLVLGDRPLQRRVSVRDVVILGMAVDAEARRWLEPAIDWTVVGSPSRRTDPPPGFASAALDVRRDRLRWDRRRSERVTLLESSPRVHSAVDEASRRVAGVVRASASWINDSDVDSIAHDIVADQLRWLTELEPSPDS